MIVAAFFFLMPLLRLVMMSFTGENGFSTEQYTSLLSERRTINAITNTIIISIGSTVISVFLGGFFAVIVAYTDVQYKRWIEILILAPFVIPSYIITLSWSTLFSARGLINTVLHRLFNLRINIYSIGGIIFVLGLCNASIVYLNLLPMLRKIPKDQEWAARVAGFNTWETFFKINLREALPAIAAGAVLAFLSSIDNFSVPAFLGIPGGIPVLSTYIYEKVIGFGPSAFRSAAALSVMLSMIALIGTGIQWLLVRKAAIMESIQEDFSQRIFLGKYRQRVERICLGFLLLINIFPLITIITDGFFPKYGARTWDNLTLENYAFVFTNRGVHQAILNSISLSALCCVICFVIGTAIAFWKVRQKSKAAVLIEQNAALTYAIPGIVLALAMILHWSTIPNVYGTMKILLIAYVTRYLILQIQSSTNAAIALDPSLEEAARISGSYQMRTWREIILPLSMRSILAGTFLIAMQALTELTLSSMLAAAGTRTIGLTIFSLQQGGDYQRAEALSTAIIFIMLILYALRIFITRKQKNR